MFSLSCWPPSEGRRVSPAACCSSETSSDLERRSSCDAMLINRLSWHCDTCRGGSARHTHSRGRGSHARCRLERSSSPGWWILTVIITCEGHHRSLVMLSLTWSPSPWASCPCRFPTPPPPRWPRENQTEHPEAENRNHNIIINHNIPLKAIFLPFQIWEIECKV